ncbi:MAG TPA: peroxiredoxin [Polyangia bacterium]|jgi:peroxiredoxin Q/BCP
MQLIAGARLGLGGFFRWSPLAAAAAMSIFSACSHNSAATSGQDGEVKKANGDLLAVGTPAPDFSSTAHDGQPVQLSQLKDRYVVLYFYPHDDTPGCTKEACDFRDAWDRLRQAGVAVFGVSTQDTTSHQAFAQKYNLPFPLLPDKNGEIAAKYHVPVFMGLTKRVTYLIGKDGRIAYVWPAVKPVGHAADILAHIPPQG